MTNYRNVHELVSDLVACALIEGAQPSLNASLETKRVKQLLLDEIEQRSRDLRRANAALVRHGVQTDPSMNTHPSDEPLPVAEPEAWLFHLWKPGEHRVYASIDENDNTWWPRDQWRGVTRVPLVIQGELTLLHGVLPPGDKIALKSVEYRCLVAGCAKPALVTPDGWVGGLCEEHNGNVGLRG